jgi:hypothetical protein
MGTDGTPGRTRYGYGHRLRRSSLQLLTRRAVQLPFLLKYHTEQLSQYSDGDAWPVILDEFVEWCTSDKHNSKPGES